MFKKGDIVQFKNIDNKWYKNRLYEITYVNKRDKKVWVRPFEGNFCYFYWKLNPNDLVKVN